MKERRHNIKSYKLERVLNKNLVSFPSSMFSKLWNTIEIDLKRLNLQKYLNKEKLIFYLENYERFKCE